MKTQLALLGIVGVITALGFVATNSFARSGSGQPPKRPDPSGEDRVASDIAKSPGCQGVRKLETSDGVKIYFSWFKNKEAALTWYNHRFHLSAMALVAQSFPGQTIHKPLRHVKDTDAPILVVTTMKHKDRAKTKPGEFPFVQLSMELYTPLPGGMTLGGRFAPTAVEIPKTMVYRRKDSP